MCSRPWCVYDNENPPPEGHLLDFSFSEGSTFDADAVLVKGGPNTNLYDYRPLGGIAADEELHAPLNPENDQLYDISHISFCLGEADYVPPNNGA
ncbi:hypothetical protein [Streptomyces sp. TRM64462]|uniref:hypothetical protein n=1 Tax=Streptomyces sp. TRM64462 TaxID=2741726 RepID=UPI001586511F|nr:hypothetical protein [Streptomyces sp. TRM64462]